MTFGAHVELTLKLRAPMRSRRAALLNYQALECACRNTELRRKHRSRGRTSTTTFLVDRAWAQGQRYHDGVGRASVHIAARGCVLKPFGNSGHWRMSLARVSAAGELMCRSNLVGCANAEADVLGPVLTVTWHDDGSNVTVTENQFGDSSPPSLAAEVRKLYSLGCLHAG